MKRKYSKKKSTVSGGSQAASNIKKISFSETPQIKKVPKLEQDVIVGESPSLELQKDGMFGYCSSEIFSKYNIWTIKDVELFMNNHDEYNKLTQDEKDTFEAAIEFCKQYLDLGKKRKWKRNTVRQRKPRMPWIRENGVLVPNSKGGMKKKTKSKKGGGATFYLSLSLERLEEREKNIFLENYNSNIAELKAAHAVIELENDENDGNTIKLLIAEVVTFKALKNIINGFNRHEEHQFDEEDHFYLESIDAHPPIQDNMKNIRDLLRERRKKRSQRRDMIRRGEAVGPDDDIKIGEKRNTPHILVANFVERGDIG